MSEDTTFLFEEHVLLGAAMEELEETGLLLPMSYPGESFETFDDATVLSDLTGLPYALLSAHLRRFSSVTDGLWAHHL